MAETVVLATTVTIGGGVLRHVRDLAGELAARGHRVRLDGPPAGVVRDAAAELGVEFRDAGGPPPRGAVYHLHLADTYERRSLALLARARRAGATVVLTEHLPRSVASDPALGPGRRTPGATRAKTGFKRAQYALCDRVIAVSASSRAFLAARYGVAADRIDVVENGLPLPSGAAGVGAPRAGVLSIGALIHQKGHDVLVRAAARSALPWSVTIAGEGVERPRLEAMAAELAPGRVRFAGWVPRAGRLATDAAVVCLPSRWESFPYVVGEARLHGAPVVAADVDGARDQLEHGRTGVLVPPDDPAALAAAVDALFADPAARLRIAAAGRDAATAWTLDRMVTATELAYRLRTREPVRG